MSQRQNQILTVLIIIAVAISGANTYLLFNHIDLQKEQYATLENIAELKDNLDDVASSLDGLQDEITSLQGNVSEAEEEIADRLAGLEAGIQETLDELSSLETTLEDMTGEISGFNSSLRDELESLSAEVSAIDEKVEDSIERTPSSVYEARRASVVKITTTAGQGSGFMWRNRNYIVTNHHVVDGAEEGGEVTISVSVCNIGEDEGSHTVELKLDGSVTDDRSLTLEGGADTTVSFSVLMEAGTHTAEIESLTGSFTITAQPEQPSQQSFPWTSAIAVGAVALVVIGLIARKYMG